MANDKATPGHQRRHWKRWRYRLGIGMIAGFLLFLFGTVSWQYRTNTAVERLTNQYGGHANYQMEPRVLGMSLEGFDLPQFIDPHFRRAFDRIDNISLHGSPSIRPRELTPITKIGGSSGVLQVTTFDDTHCDYLGKYETGALWLESRNITAEGFRKIGRNERLGFLALNHMEIDDSIAKAISEFPNLRYLYLWGDTEVTPNGLLSLSGENIRGLTLPKGITLEHCQSLQHWSALEDLTLAEWMISEEALAELVSKLPRLKKIEVRGPHHLSQAFLEETFGEGGVKIFFLPGWN